MAHLTSFHSVDMSDSIFVENEGDRTLTATDMIFRAPTRSVIWEFGASNITHHFNATSNHEEIDTGTISSTRYFTNDRSVAIFEALDIPNVSATTIWNAFQLSDNAALFGTLLIGNDTVNGSAENDTLGGYDGDDVVLGGLGLDRVSGGTGDDLVNGGAGDDRVLGARGADTVAGGADNDTLEGGSGRDMFLFENKGAANADRIQDFTEVADKIVFDLDIFPALLDVGALRPGMFKDIAASIGDTVDRNDRILYDSDHGKLYYDPDGSGDQARVLVATVFDAPGSHPDLAAGDFRVVA